MAGDMAGEVGSAATADPTAYVVNPNVRVVRCSDDELLVKHGTRSLFSEIIADPDRTKLLGRVLDRLKRPATVDDLVREGVVGPDDVQAAADAVEYLRRRGVVAAAAESMTKVYLDTLVGGTSRLEDASVAVAGVGALGSRVARELAALGPRQLALLGADPLPSPTAGANGSSANARPAAEVLVEELRRDGHEEVEARVEDLHDEDALGRLLDGADFLVVTLDGWSPTVLHAANAAAIARETPWMASFFDGSEAIIGPTYVPGETSCYFDFERQQEASLGLKDEYHLYKEDLFRRPGAVGGFVLPPYADVAAGLTTTAALRFLVSGTTFTIDRAVRVDFERASIDYQDVFRLPRCPACTGLRPPHRHLFL